MKKVILSSLLTISIGLLVLVLLVKFQILPVKPQPTPTPSIKTYDAWVVLPIEEMVNKSSLIIHGKVQEIKSTRDNPNDYIYSTVTIAPIESFKKDVSTPLAVRILGGTIDNIVEEASFEADFREGEEVVVFLKPDPKKPEVYRVYEGFQGKFTVLEGEVSRGIGSEPAIKLDDLKTGIKKIVGGQSFKRRNNLGSSFSALFVKPAYAYQLARFGFFGDTIRWFPENIPVPFYMEYTGSSYIGQAVFDAVRTGLQRWSEAGAGISLYDAGWYVSSNIGEGWNDRNEIAFHDPKNLLGSLMAATWTRRDCWQRMAVNSDNFCKLLETDIIIQDIMREYNWYVVIVTHELGHAIGLDHSEVAEAIMVASVSLSHSGLLHDDDRAGAQYIYPAQSSVSSSSYSSFILPANTKEANFGVLPSSVSCTLTINGSSSGTINTGVGTVFNISASNPSTPYSISITGPSSTSFGPFSSNPSSATWNSAGYPAGSYSVSNGCTTRSVVLATSYRISGRIISDANKDACLTSTQGIPAVNVTATNLSNSQTSTLPSDANGYYSFNTLISGNYSMAISNFLGKVVAVRIGGFWYSTGSPVVSPLTIPPNQTLDYCIDTSVPWLKTTSGDVHSNIRINTPGGP